MNQKRRGLGQGLGALIRNDTPLDGAMTAPSGALQTINITLIVPNPHQPRQSFASEALEELSESIQMHGILQPLVVSRTANGYELIAGERRWRAAQLAGLSEVPVIIKDVTPQERLELALIENIQRADLNPLEEAEAYHLLHVEFDLSHSEIAKRVGKSRPAISNAMRLLRMPDPLKQAVMDQRLTAGHIKQLITIDDERTQLLALEQILDHRLSVRESEKMAQLIKHDGQTPAQARITIQQAGAQPRAARSKQTTAEPTHTPTPQPNVDAVLERLMHRLGTRVEVRRHGAKSYLQIEFYDEEQLDALIHMLTPDDLAS